MKWHHNVWIEVWKECDHSLSIGEQCTVLMKESFPTCRGSGTGGPIGTVTLKVLCNSSQADVFECVQKRHAGISAPPRRGLPSIVHMPHMLTHASQSVDLNG